MKKLNNENIELPDYYFFGTKSEVKKELIKWFQQFDDVQIISDVCHYDMVLFIDIFGSAFDIPKNISPVCHDINQDIALYYNISEREAFDKSREEILQEHTIVIKGIKHTALYDAEVIMAIHKLINDSFTKVL